MKEIVYKDQLIREFDKKDVTYYLYDEDGDIVEYSAKSVEEAKEMIDEYCKEHNGFYNADGELY